MKNVISILILTYGFLSLSVSLASDRCIHLGDSQSSASPFSKALQQDLASMNYQVYTYARPSSRTSHWADAKISSSQGPKLTKGGFVFYPTKNQLASDESQVTLSDSETIPWAEKVFEHHQKKAPLDCIILQFGDNIDSWRSNQKLLEIVKKMKSKTGKCFWVSPTWSEPDRGYAHMNDKKKIEIRREIEKSLKSYDCQLVSTTGYGDSIDYSFKEKLKSIGRYTSDGLHLNKTGGKMWADEVFAQIKPTLQGSSALNEEIRGMENVSDALSPPSQKSCP